MKSAFIAIMGFLLTLSTQAQIHGLVFTNGVGSLVTNGVTGGPVTFNSNAVIRVGLYMAPAGVTDEGAFVLIANGVPVGLPTPGRYNGGNLVVPGFSLGDPVVIQVRAYESTYGNTYEEALLAPPMNGRRALVGKSKIGQVILGGTGGQTPKVGPVVGPIFIYPVDGPPLITGTDVAVAEGSNGVATATFEVRLSNPATSVVSVDFATVDGTALAGSDYVATNGTLVFLPGETAKNIPVTLIPDGPTEESETFSLVLSNPVEGVLVRNSILCTIVEVRITGLSIDTSITFNTLVGRRYRVEKSVNGIDWFSVPGVSDNLTATGSSLTVIDRGSGCQGMSIYRANLLP